MGFECAALSTVEIPHFDRSITRPRSQSVCIDECNTQDGLDMSVQSGSSSQCLIISNTDGIVFTIGDGAGERLKNESAMI